MTKRLISNADYHNSPAVGSTTLKTIDKKSVYHAVNQKLEQTDALLLGQLLHALILEPETVEDAYAVKPVVDRRTKSGKALYAEFLEEAELKTIVSSDIWKQANEMAKAILDNPVTENLLSGGESEMSYFAKDALNIERKCRLDYRKGNTIVDIKSTLDASPQGFMRSIMKFNYHLQAAYYMDTVNLEGTDQVNDFIFIAVEKTAPFAVGVYRLDAQSLLAGRKRYAAALTDLAEFKASDKPSKDFGYSNEVVDIELPIYELEAAEQKLEGGL